MPLQEIVADLDGLVDTFVLAEKHERLNVEREDSGRVEEVF